MNARQLLGRFKSKETDFLAFITKIHISRYVNPTFMAFMSKNLQHSEVLEWKIVFSLQKLLFFISFDGVKLKIKK